MSRKISAINNGKALLVNVTVENLAPCKKLVRVEVELKEVDAAFDKTTKEYQRQAVLPGFRPGKAPREIVLRKYEKDIHDDVKQKLISDAYRKALTEQKLNVIGYPDIEEIQFGRGQVLHFAATVETAPEFELPERPACRCDGDAVVAADSPPQAAKRGGVHVGRAGCRKGRRQAGRQGRCQAGRQGR